MTQRFWYSWGFLVLLVITAACSLDTRSYRAPAERLATTAAPEAGNKEAVPAALRAAYVASVQKDAPAAYHIERAASGLQATSHAQRLVAEFAATGVQIAPAAAEGGEAFGIAATEWGCKGSLTPVSPAEPEAQGNRVTYRREGFDEWYVNGPLGLEQGFTLPAPPACNGAGDRGVVIALGGGGALHAEVLEHGNAAVLRDRSGKEVLRSTDLYVVDATGRQLPATLAGGAGGLSIRVDDRGGVYPIEVDPLWTEQQTLTASDAAAGDRFGFSVAVSGDTAVVGAYRKASNQGTAYVFVRSGSSWTQQQTLTASDAAAGDYFGFSVAVSGDTAVVGAVEKASLQGAAYVFVRSGSSWTQQQTLTASDGAANDEFGWSVAVSGDTAVVGADDKASYQGAAYVFVRSGSSWTQQQTLTASDAAAGDWFGVSVAVSGDTAVVGAFGKASYQGAAYVFVRSGSSWIQQQTLTAGDAAPGDYFGVSVAISGDTAVVGADDKASYQGAAYVFVHSGSSWTQQQKLTASDVAPGDRFGWSVAVSGDTAVVGALGKASDQGAAYVFVLSLINGDACSTAAKCLSGYCVDGVCCDTACGGGIPNDCQACSKAKGASADGTCTTLFTGMPCDDHNLCTQDDTCRMGECKGIAISCDPPWSRIAPTTFGSLCNGQEDCDAIQGYCVAEGAVKVCCKTPCTDLCHSCALPGHAGECMVEPQGVDLRNVCSPGQTCISTCSGPVESGMPYCIGADTGTQCAPGRCTDKSHRLGPAVCLAKGAPCPEGIPEDCDRYACNPADGTCLKACASVDDCAPPLVCDLSHQCVPAPGVAVGTDRACAFEPASPAGSGARGALTALALTALFVVRRRRSARRAAM